MSRPRAIKHRQAHFWSKSHFVGSKKKSVKVRLRTRVSSSKFFGSVVRASIKHGLIPFVWSSLRVAWLQFLPKSWPQTNVGLASKFGLASNLKWFGLENIFYLFKHEIIQSLIHLKYSTNITLQTSIKVHRSSYVEQLCLIYVHNLIESSLIALTCPNWVNRILLRFLFSNMCNTRMQHTLYKQCTCKLAFEIAHVEHSTLVPSTGQSRKIE